MSIEKYTKIEESRGSVKHRFDGMLRGEDGDRADQRFWLRRSATEDTPERQTSTSTTTLTGVREVLPHFEDCTSSRTRWSVDRGWRVLASYVGVSNVRMRMQERTAKFNADDEEPGCAAKRRKLEDIENQAMVEKYSGKLAMLFEECQKEELSFSSKPQQTESNVTHGTIL